MVSNERLMEMSEALDGAEAFLDRVLAAVTVGANDELREDIYAAPEFLEEMKEAVDELIKYRGLDRFKSEIRATIPGAFVWERRGSSLLKRMWNDIVDVGK